MEQEPQDLDNALIGIVYDTAVDPTFWPVILEGFGSVMAGDMDQPAVGSIPLSRESPAHRTSISGLTDTLNQRQSADAPSQAGPTQERRLAAKLTPHIKRAFELNRRLTKAEIDRNLLQDLYGQLPFGILIVDEHDQILSINKAAAEIISTSSKLWIDSQHLCTNDPCLKKLLRSLFHGDARRLCHRCRRDVIRLELNEISEQPGVTLVLGPERSFELASLGRRRLRTLFLCADKYESMLSVQRLIEMYGLTEREARIARLVACGLDTQAIAERDGVKVTTVRDQLKAIFAKTEVHSQTKLAFMILTNPALWSTPEIIPRFVPSTYMEPKHSRESSIALPDGRTLSYAEYGDLTGFPVFFIHSIWGCRYERYPYDHLTAQHGVRLIVPDRPGYGKSTYQPHYTYAQWGRDFAVLCETLGIEECSIISFAATSYALGCAHVAPQLLRRVLLYCPWGPIDGLKDVLMMPPQFRFLLGLGLYMPLLAKKFFELHIRSMCQHPKRMFRQIVEHSPQIDQRVLNDPRLEGLLTTSIYEGSLRSIHGLVDDYCKYTLPWDLPFADITKPIDIYIGDHDLEIFIHMAGKLARMLPAANVHTVPDAGVYSIFSRWTDVLNAAVSKHGVG